MPANIEDVSRRLGLKGMIKRGGEKWRTQEIKQLDEEIKTLNERYYLLSKAEIVKTPSIKEDIRAILERCGSTLWPVIQDRASQCRWLHAAHEVAEYPEDLYFPQHVDRIYPNFETLLLSKLERYHDNHTRSKLPSESDLTEFEESEESQAPVNKTVEGSAGPEAPKSLVLKFSLPKHRDKLQALRTEDEDNAPDSPDYPGSQSVPIVSRKRKASHNTGPANSLTGASKRQRSHATVQSDIQSSAEAGSITSATPGVAPSLPPSMSDSDATLKTRRALKSGAAGRQTNPPLLESAINPQVRRDSLTVQQSNPGSAKASTIKPEAEGLGITGIQHSDDHGHSSVDELGIPTGRAQAQPEDSEDSDDDAPVFPKQRNNHSSSSSSFSRHSGSPLTSLSKATPDAPVSSLPINSQISKTATMRHQQEGISFNPGELRYHSLSSSSSGRHTGQRSPEKESDGDRGQQFGPQKPASTDDTFVASLSRDRSLVRRTAWVEPSEKDPVSQPSRSEAAAQIHPSPSVVIAISNRPYVSPYSGPNSTHRPSHRSANLHNNSTNQSADRPFTDFGVRHMASVYPSQFTRYHDHASASPKQPLAEPHDLPTTPIARPHPITHPPSNTQRLSEEPRTPPRELLIGVDLHIHDRVAFRTLELDDSYDVYQVFTTIRDRFKKVLDGKPPTELVLTFMDKTIRGGKEYFIEEDRGGDKTWKIFLSVLRETGSFGEGVEGVVSV